jgi:predicted TIM-barrel fold metal-dependent hydrolase
MRRLTRRELLAAGTAVAGLRGRMAFAKASQPATPVDFEVPPGACDCHTHLIGDPAKFPFAAARVYTPEPASAEEMAALHRALHIRRVVIVTPSFYGTDNSATLSGMRARGKDARGIAVIDEKTPPGDLEAMDASGIRGVRLNLATAGQNDPIAAGRLLRAAAKRIRHLNWHIQVNTNLTVIAGIRNVVAESPVPVVFDHFGGAQSALGTSQKGWPDLVGLVRSGKAYVKVSGAYSVSARPPDYPDITPFAKELVAANPDRILWGSDWPHTTSLATRRRPITEVTPLTAIDDGRLLNRLAVWVPDADSRRKILVDNPARLYRF